LDSVLLKKVEIFVKELFSNKAAKENLYHSITHTTEVVDIAEKIGLAEGISQSDLEILLIACWFHDTGHLHCCIGHEDHSSVYAEKYLIRNSYPKEGIDKIIGCIKATKIPQQKNKLEEIICDADLHHLGQTNIYERGELLRKEFELRGFKKLSDPDWLKKSIDFFKNHIFFTEYARKEFGSQKELNLNKMEKKLGELEIASK
jgi:predicted metal-dependent HD superfamily phosphohydrolase